MCQPRVRRLFARRVPPLVLCALAFVPLAACGGVGQGLADEPVPTGPTLVRVHVASFLGTEGLTLDSDLQPALFTLDPRIDRVTIQAVNPTAPNKHDTQPGTWRPALTPVDAGNPVAGEIRMLVQLAPATSLGWEAVHVRTGATFASNPSSLLLLRVTGGVEVPLRTIPLDAPRSTTTALGGSVSSESLLVVWRAGSELGENGGGSAGFEDLDILITEAPVP